jgi:class 3 adenylate cyclase
MVFVNEIGEIVHGIVDKYSGAANKNIGDAFLLVWKFDPSSFIYDEATDDITLATTNEVK